ncbi:MAG: HAD hydrolase family protein [Desulfamplus sp.]|nr:HAD hydrolase family protein [Desulfamplus sp.]MBF0259022.1 HAD hydrolase family protein [Desulfamplus sp.]
MKARLKAIKLLLLDVDGVMTDGKITYTDSGEEIKSFCSKDGFGIRLLMDAGINVGIITGRAANGALTSRCINLGIHLVLHGIKNKAAALNEILASQQIDLSEVAFAGDDIPDIPAMQLCGVSFAVANASPEVIKQADYTTSNRGGDGAVREICEAILKAKDLWKDILNQFTSTVN